MQIEIFDEQSSFRIQPELFQKHVRVLCDFLSIQTKEIFIYFVTRKKIAQLHEQIFQDPTPTDCISLPMDEETLGEIFVCTDVALEYAQENNIPPLEEITLYVVHGLLHLIGYDDISEKDRMKMREKERECLQFLKVQKLLP